MKDLVMPERVHIVGIGGAGMSAIAMVLSERGVEVSGSDLKASSSFERLRGYGVELYLGHQSSNVRDAQVVVISSAIRQSNPEVLAALQKGIPVLDRSEFFPILLGDSKVIGVAGTHGKTTTTSMLTLCLLAGGLSPSYIIGGELNETGTSAAKGAGDYFVIEADESDKSFMALGAYGVIVGNLEPDHIENYNGYEDLKDHFFRFVKNAEGPKLIGSYLGDVGDLLSIEGVKTFGVRETDDFCISNVSFGEYQTHFDLNQRGSVSQRVELVVPGMHNALNAAGAIAMAVSLGVGIEVAANSLLEFTGVSRRYQRKGEVRGVQFIDDYAHLPSEIRAVIEATRAQWPHSRIVVAFQPHRYSRTARLADEFGDALAGGDLVIIGDVYSAGEDQIPGVSGELIAVHMNTNHPNVEVLYHPSRSDMADFSLALISEGDIFLTLGAGDITSLAQEMIDRAGLRRDGAQRG
ncbi:UDP-N-acetylmuramate--L-alanine ligase [Acidithrix sp. C25]|uniref:UDP-N-acetylmuramate--L-alanine ligase n=1 Tax=Acidithrix sp. C25 TaxID=1671482 RepID=UPI00191B9D9C|nr:UDP-N-acetylmuramate--L-alanine ligase [Acidithrix sp. C25]CAG4901325.1 unnamed protein product [Acidithrix sp. C25]